VKEGRIRLFQGRSDSRDAVARKGLGAGKEGRRPMSAQSRPGMGWTECSAHGRPGVKVSGRGRQRVAKRALGGH
jgi:hypothetical protein